MTPKQRREYSELHRRVLKRMEAPHVKPVYDALHSQILSFTHVLRTSTIEHARQQIDRVLINTELVKPITDLYRTFGFYMARKTTREINRSARERIMPKEQKAGFGNNDPLTDEIIKYLKENLLTKAVFPITETTRRDILAMLEKGIKEGWGVDRIAFELERPDFLLWRARMIVRTESLFAMQYGQKTAAKQSKWETESEWIAANDHRTRHSHREVDGKKVDEGKRIKVNRYRSKKAVNILIGFDMMLGPGDPHAHADNVINCRCSLVTVAKRDANGRLIVKRRTPSRVSVIMPGNVFTPHTSITIGGRKPITQDVAVMERQPITKPVPLPKEKAPSIKPIKAPVIIPDNNESVSVTLSIYEDRLTAMANKIFNANNGKRTAEFTELIDIWGELKEAREGIETYGGYVETVQHNIQNATDLESINRLQARLAAMQGTLNKYMKRVPKLIAKAEEALKRLSI